MIPVRITASGMVASVDKDHHSFILFPTQTVTACLDPQNLPVCAVLEKGPKWPNPIARLPLAYNFVAFTSKFAYFKDDVGPVQSNMCFCAVVTLESITYLCANYAANSGPSHAPSSQIPDADMIALKLCVLKFSHLGKQSASSSSSTCHGKAEKDGDLTLVDGNSERVPNI